MHIKEVGCGEGKGVCGLDLSLKCCHCRGIRGECEASTCGILLEGPPGYQGARCWWRSWLSYCAQAGRSQVRFQMVSLEFFIDIILPAAL